MDINTAIDTLQELVGQGVKVPLPGGIKDSGGRFRVVSIDFFSNPETRCVVARNGVDDAFPTMWCPVGDVSIDRKFLVADALINAAPDEELTKLLTKPIRHE